MVAVAAAGYRDASSLATFRCLGTSGQLAQQGVLTAAALGGYFFVMTLHSVVVAILGAALAACMVAVMAEVRKMKHSIHREK